jgi:23S rRNA pseudouridine2605 synthase
LIRQGRVRVNGEIVTELGTKADGAVDEIRVDGKPIRAAADKVYLLLFKPKGYVTTRSDPGGRNTVMELVPRVPGLFPVGRLDVNTEGLLLLTNDGAFAQRVAHPSYEVARVYHAKVRGTPDTTTLERLTRGVTVDGVRMAVDRARLIEGGANAWLEITLHEGRNREVRRLLESVGHPVSKLRRVSLGPLTLRGLKAGAFRSLAPAEIAKLLGPGSKRPGRKAPPQRRRNA